MEFLDKNGTIAMLEGLGAKLGSRFGQKVSSVTSGSSNIFVDNTDPNNPVIGIDPGFVQKINEIYDLLTSDTEREVSPAAAIDFGTETLNGFNPNTVYKIFDVEYTSDADGKIQIQAGWFGTSIEVIAVSTSPEKEDSLPQTIYINHRPAAPTSVTKIDAVNGLSNGELRNVTEDMEWSITGSGSWIDVSGTSITDLSPGTYAVRVKGTGTSFVGPAVELIIENITVKTPEATPISTINYEYEILENLLEEGEYTINGSGVSADIDGTLDIDPSWIGTTIQIIKLSTGEFKDDSDPQSLIIPARPAAPAVTKVDATDGLNNGEINNVTSDMEVMVKGTDIWIPITGTSYTGLTPEEYYVRLKATTTSFSSLSTTIVIVDVTSSQTGWTLTYTYTGPAIIDNDEIPFVDWVGYDGSQELDEDQWYITEYEDQHTHLYAKYVTDSDFVEVGFDAVVGQVANGIGNSLSYWGFWEGNIYIYGNNATSSPIQLKLVREG